MVVSKAFLERSRLKSQLGQRDEAKLDLINSLILDSNQPKVEFNVGLLYLDLKMPEKAVPELLKALEISRMQSGSFIDTKHLAQCLNYVAAALIDLSRYTEAEKYLQESLALSNDLPFSKTNETTYIDTARINLAICLVMQGYTYNNANSEYIRVKRANLFNKAKMVLQKVVFSWEKDTYVKQM